MSEQYEQEPPSRPPPWGPWATLGWFVILALACIAAQIGLVILFIVGKVCTGSIGDLLDYAIGLEKDGFFFAVSTIFVDGVLVALLLPITLLRSWRFADYLALKPTEWREALRYGGLMALLVIALDFLTRLLGRPVVTDFQVTMYESATSVPLLLFAVILAAPVCEEIVFRGFLFIGLASSRLGAWGATALTSGIWATIHFQYDWYGMMLIFIFGLFLGFARSKTGSTTIAIFLHCVLNAIATIETVVVMEFLR